MEKLIVFTPAFDKRDPDPSKNYGIHGVDLRMVLKGKLGVVQFVLFTGWQLPHVQKEMGLKKGYFTYIQEPMPADLGYHSPNPTFKGQTPTDECPYIEGGTCYYDGSGLNAEPIYKKLLEEGSDGVWKELEKFYKQVFNKLK